MEQNIIFNTDNRCKNCGKETTIRKDRKQYGYNKFCCIKCRNEYKIMHSLYYDKVSNFDWLYNQRITLRKSKETIAEELGCSVTVINKWIKNHNLPNIKYNESDYKTKQVLQSKEDLQHLYIDENKTCAQIAKEIGSSTSTVAKSLNELGIEIKNSNLYPRQFKRVSTGEQEVVEYIRSIYNGRVETCNRSILDGKELDIYIPDLNLAFEFDGVFFHNSNTKHNNYHVDKTLGCSSKGIQLIHIFDVDWFHKKDVWKMFIRNKLQRDSNRVYGRKCVVKQISAHEKNLFLSKYHLQGTDASNIKLGLFYHDELISVMTFKTSRYNKQYKWELVRYAVKGDCVVIGGFSKLLNYFRKSHRNESIISYADRMYSCGSVYRVNGFKLIKTNKPTYRYYDPNKNILINRMNATKSVLTKRINQLNLNVNCSEMSESDLAKQLNYYKIYDCGTLTYVLE